MPHPIKILIFLLIIIAVIIGFYWLIKPNNPINTANNNADTNADLAQPTNGFTLPLADALSRVTKKPFGLKVSPQDSPVSPEKFSGYHTGVDFETLPGEQNIEVPVYAICSGELALKKQATGYGGVAVQSCSLDGQDITVVYGHLKLASISATVGQKLAAGEQLGILGRGYSVETDGERKHLHLGVHKGAAINILGYVQKQSELASWIDVLTLLK